MSVVIGSNLNEVSVRRGKDPNQGLYTVRVYEGTAAAINGVVAQLAVDQAWEIDDSDKPLYRLTIRTPDDDTQASSTESVDEWELVSNFVQKDIFGHPNFASLTKTEVETIKNALDNPGSITQFPSNPLAITLYLLALKGTTVYNDSEYVLRKTITVSRRYQAKAAFVGSKKIITTAALTNQASPYYEPIPGDVLFSIGEIPVPADQNGYQWGWLKQTPQVVSAAGSKTKIIQEYWLDQWSTDLYDVAE